MEQYIVLSVFSQNIMITEGGVVILAPEMPVLQHQYHPLWQLIRGTVCNVK